MTDRRGHAVGHDGDRQVLLQRVEIAGRDAARDHVEAALREQRDRVRGGVEQLDLDLDVVILEVALLDRDQLRAVRHRARHADTNDLLLCGRAERREQHAGKDQARQHRFLRAFLLDLIRRQISRRFHRVCSCQARAVTVPRL
jgi:hypothetical protein